MKRLLILLIISSPTLASDDVCKDLIVDITNNYDVAQLEVVRNGNPYVTETVVACTYKGTTPEIWGDRPVVLNVLLNADTGRFQVDVR
ncbi:hypothetical protein SAMN05216206_0614 [Pseudomonas guineae]|uniref:Uncharacterized protein n=1 Tax=Pseudomonas guineae TaxID=425504 RepID=A0A1I3DNG2_9PSED|nr:hypothetical protein SAMN05216206_0614 [Pseudomonas guineae]